MKLQVPGEEIPSTKFQIPSIEITSSKIQDYENLPLELGIWNLEFNRKVHIRNEAR